MSPSTNVPLWTARVAALAMAWAWSIISFATTISAVVKSNHDKDKVKAFAPRGAQVDIDDSDVFSTGAVITAVSIVIFVLTSLYLLALLLRPKSLTQPRTVAAQGGLLAFLLAFCAAWLFATLVPYTHFFRTRSAVVTATIGGVSLPESFIHTVERQLGVSSVYRNLSYLRLVAILPWFELLFTIIAAVILFMTASRSRSTKPVEGPLDGANRNSEATDEKVKPSIDHVESPTV